MKTALTLALALVVSATILALVWTAPVVESAPDLCVTCMGWEAQRLAMTFGIAVAWVVIPIRLLVAEPEPGHETYDGCESCNWRRVDQIGAR